MTLTSLGIDINHWRDVLEPPLQKLEEREGEAQPLEPQALIEVAARMTLDFSNGGDGILWEDILQLVAVWARLYNQVLFTHDDELAPLQHGLTSTTMVSIYHHRGIHIDVGRLATMVVLLLVLRLKET